MEQFVNKKTYDKLVEEYTLTLDSYRKEAEKVYKKAQQQIQLFEEMCSLNGSYDELMQRVDKACEYIEKFVPIEEDTIVMRQRQIDYILDILKGNDN